MARLAAALALTLALVTTAGPAGAQSDATDDVVQDPVEVEDAPVLDWRVACIEAKESGGANVANLHGSGAVGVMQFMPSTFYAHAAEMGHWDWSPWTPWQARLVAAHDLALGRRRQWTVGGCN